MKLPEKEEVKRTKELETIIDRKSGKNRKSASIKLYK